MSRVERGQNIWQKLKDPSKIRQDQETLITAFSDLFNGIAKNLFLWGILDTRSCPRPISGFS